MAPPISADERKDPSKSWLGRKLSKTRKPYHTPSMQYPDRLQIGDDAQTDVSAPKGNILPHMHQSILSMIAVAGGSATNFHARFNEESSGSEGEDEQERPQKGKANVPASAAVRSNVAAAAAAAPRASESLSQSESQMPPPRPLLGKRTSSVGKGSSSTKRSESKLLKALPRLNLRTIQEKNYMSHSILLSPRTPISPLDLTRYSSPRNAPVMSQMLEAQAKLDSTGTSAEGEEEFAAVRPGDIDRLERRSSTIADLSTRLMEIFGFEEPEEVISEYPCWLLQSVLLQGYMYITANHICFYAYLPKKSNVTAKSGYLAKRGKNNPKFNRYWFTLKGDVLSYYTDPSDLYFPSGTIDLRYGVSAALVDSKEKGKEAIHFTVTTQNRTFNFRGDSSESAKEWVKNLQKVIFRSHNDGDSVKISIPIENVLDIEESPVIDFAETFKVRVVDSNETYAIDEYFFTFFSFGKDAFDVLTALIENTPAQRISMDYLSPRHLGNGRSPSPGVSRGSSIKRLSDRSRSPGTPLLRDNVRATLSPAIQPVDRVASPRPSGEWSRSRASIDVPRRSMDLDRATGRASFDMRGRRSVSTSRVLSTNPVYEVPPSPLQAPTSSESYVQSIDPGTDSSIPMGSSDDLRNSASQILDRSDVFHAPTITRRFEVSPDRMRGRPEGGVSTTHKPEDQIRNRPSKAQMDIVSVHPSEKVAKSKKSPNFGEDREGGEMAQRGSTPSIQQIVKAGSYPLQRAAGFLRTRSKRMSNLLATESMGYVEKVSGMWAGGRQHYDVAEGLAPETGEEPDEEGDVETYGERFRTHFALPATEKLQATYFGYLHRVLPLYGKIYISNRKFCFRSLLPGTRTKLILPLKDIENVDKEKGFRFGYSGLVVVIRAFEELFFEFSSSDVRDDCAVTLLQSLESIRYLQESGILTQEDKAEQAKTEHQMLQEARMADGRTEHELKLPKSTDVISGVTEHPPILFDDPRASIINFKPTESLRITCLTIGSRGDVQPYIALCKGLLAEGHRPRIATHAEFEPWVRKHGIDFAPVDGDPAELMRICVEHGMFTYSFLKEASVKFRGWIDELLSSSWKACQDSDVLIESPSAMAGIHIAEALEIPYFRAFTMPWTRTRAYPHAFAVPERKMGGAYNYITYVMFDNVFWTAIAGQVNRWRKKELGLRSTNLDKLHPNKVPFLYNFSPSVVVPPLDYSDWIRVTGYWFLDEASGWTAPTELTAFIDQARADGKKLIYIGFGSIVVSDPAAITRTVVESVLKADVRCILSKGWSDRLGNKEASAPEIPLPPEIHQIKAAPHDWLFQQIDAAVHHGGAGTTGASLRAGLPTIVKPFFGDQFFFGSRIEDLGVGVCMKKLNVSVFSRALWEVTHSERMILKAKVLGEQIRKEDGVGTAIQAIYRDLEYAKSLIKRRSTGSTAENEIGDEESWTFIGDESDPELARRIAEWEAPPRKASTDVKRHLSVAATTTSPVGGFLTPTGLGGEKEVEKEKERGRGFGMKFLRRPSREIMPST
ncbi:Sterol 3-beta-glucosyltransferase [Agyrium rufum]|nr:Sterol 3-beta-glucosyltransferase [Agyrium rufum]